MTDGVEIGGGDTATPCNLAKRVALIESVAGLRRRRVLDAGCGAGEYVEAFVGRGADAVGVEFDAQKVTSYRQHHPESNRVAQGDLVALPFPVANFDVVVLNEVLEHAPDQMRVLCEIHRVLCGNGVLVLFSPNRLYPFETHGVRWRRTGRTLSPWLPLVPYVPLALGRRLFVYPARNYWPSELGRIVTAAGFEIVGRRWLWQTFENISGQQPHWATLLRPALRLFAGWLENCPGLRCFGVSQMVFAEKP